MPRPRLALAALVGYLIGTLPSAVWAARVATAGRTDIRTVGSGNPGAANAIGVLGKGWGVAVMGADVGKGALACRVGGRVAGDAGQHIAGTAAVIGHCHPVWSGFRGGKGVATTVGQVLATFPVYAPVDFGVAAAVHSMPGWRNRAFAAVGASSAVWVSAAWLWRRRGWSNGWGPAPTPALPVAALVSSAVVLNRFAQEERRPLVVPD